MSQSQSFHHSYSHLMSYTTKCYYLHSAKKSIRCKIYSDVDIRKCNATETVRYSVQNCSSVITNAVNPSTHTTNISETTSCMGTWTNK